MLRKKKENHLTRVADIDGAGKGGGSAGGRVWIPTANRRGDKIGYLEIHLKGAGFLKKGNLWRTGFRAKKNTRVRSGGEVGGGGTHLTTHRPEAVRGL